MLTKTEMTDLESVKQLADTLVFDFNRPVPGWAMHAYIYENEGKLGILWHIEDKYLSAFLPSHRANILLHGTIRFHEGKPGRYIEWEQRRTNITNEDIEVLRSALGADLANRLVESIEPTRPQKGKD